jgi:hypothetical protein
VDKKVPLMDCRLGNKIFVTEGKRKGQVVEGLKISEWEPIE